MSKFLDGVTGGLRNRPLRVTLYGTRGVGKSTWAKDAPSPIFMDENGGTDELDVKRFPRINSFPDALIALDELRTDKHDYQTFVLDTADWLEPLIWKHVCEKGILGKNGKREPAENLEAWSYGKGYLVALDEWRVVISKLESLEDDRNMNIVILAHSHVKSIDPPDSEKYDVYQMKLNRMSAALIGEWTKALLFATFEVYTVKEDKTDKRSRAKAYGEGARIVHTSPRPAWEAKSRYPLPAKLPLSWDEFERYARRRVEGQTKDASAQIEELLGKVDDVTVTQGRAALCRCGADPEKLSKLLEWLRGKVLTAA